MENGLLAISRYCMEGLHDECSSYECECECEHINRFPSPTDAGWRLRIEQQIKSLGTNLADVDYNRKAEIDSLRKTTNALEQRVKVLEGRITVLEGRQK